MSGYVNPIFSLFEGQVEDTSISSSQWVRFVPEESDISRTSLNRISIKTKTLDDYLFLSDAYLSITFHVGLEATPHLLTGADNYTLGSVLAGIFRKFTLSLNGVPVNENDNAQFNIQIQQLLNWSQDYQNKRGREMGLFYDSAADNQAATLLANARASHGLDLIKTGGAAGTDPKRIQFKLPLSMVFGFCKANTGLIRGMEIRIDLEKNPNRGEYLFGGAAGNNDAIAIVDEVELWIQRIVPSLQAENFYLSNLSSGKSQRIIYEDAVTYLNTITKPIGVNGFSLQIQSNSRKPRYIFVGMKNLGRFRDANAIANHPSLYDANLLENVQLRINSENLPREPLQLNFADSTLTKAQNASRPYRELVELMQGSEADNGNLLSYDSYLHWYGIISWDLSNEKPSLFQNINNNYIELVVNRMDNAALTFDVVTTIVWEREIEMRGTNKSLEIKRM